MHMTLELLITINKMMEYFMIPSNRKSTHPGIILFKEFLELMGLTQNALAKYRAAHGGPQPKMEYWSTVGLE